MKYTFLPASPLSYLSHLKNSQINESDFGRFLSQYTPGCLHCCWEDISGPKSISNIDERINRSLDKLNKEFPNVPIVLDSGGFQISNGKFPKAILEEYMHKYYEFMSNNTKYDKIFVLDIPPSKLFHSWKEVKEWNEMSYSLAYQSNNGRGIFVFHAHDLSLYNIWSELFDKYNEGFDFFSIGGVAAGNLGSLNRIVVYALLFRSIIQKCLDTNRKHLNLHILGAGMASPSLTFLFALFSDLIEKVYGITIELTSDASQHARLSRGRYFYYINNGIYTKTNYFTKNLKQNNNGISREQFIIDKINEFSYRHGFNYTINSLYKQNGQYVNEFYNLMCLYDIEIYIQLQEMIKGWIPNVVDSFFNDIELFYYNCLDCLIPINGGKLTRNLKVDAQNIIKFCEIIMDKDINRTLMLLQRNNKDMFLQEGILKL